MCDLSSLQYGTFVPLSSTSVPLTSARLAVLSVSSQVQVFQITNKEVKKQVSKVTIRTKEEFSFVTQFACGVSVVLQTPGRPGSSWRPSPRIELHELHAPPGTPPRPEGGPQPSPSAARRAINSSSFVAPGITRSNPDANQA